MRRNRIDDQQTVLPRFVCTRREDAPAAFPVRTAVGGGRTQVIAVMM